MQQTEKLVLKDAFSELQLVVPDYQRAYSWNEKQVQELFDDIVYANNNYEGDENKYHYFGTIVLEQQ